MGRKSTLGSFLLNLKKLKEYVLHYIRYLYYN